MDKYLQKMAENNRYVIIYIDGYDDEGEPYMECPTFPSFDEAKEWGLKHVPNFDEQMIKDILSGL